MYSALGEMLAMAGPSVINNPITYLRNLDPITSDFTKGTVGEKSKFQLVSLQQPHHCQLFTYLIAARDNARKKC